MHPTRLAALLSALMVSACGGGSNGTTTAPVTTIPLSEAQKNYESMALSANGGLHYLSGMLGYSTSSTGTAITPDSYFYTTDSSIPLSPASGPQQLAVALTTVASTLKLPPSVPAPRYLVNGIVYTLAAPAQAQVSYKGDSVLETKFAADGKTVVYSTLGTSYLPVPITGLIAASPDELLSSSSLNVLTNTVNGISPYNKQAVWQTGAAYMKVVRKIVGDTLAVGDCFAPVTSGSNLTPCSTTASTLEAFFPQKNSDGTSLQLNDGKIVVLAGVRAWVANTPLHFPTEQYRTFFEYNGKIAIGTLGKDGTTLQLDSSSGSTPQNFYVFLNKAALQSVKSAVNF